MLATLSLIACSTPDAERLVVFAASSLANPLAELAVRWEAQNPRIELVQVFDGSNRLRTQLEHGAPAEVFISADALQMEMALEAGLVVDPVPLAGNLLVVAIAPGNPGGIEGLADLGRPGVKVAMAGPDVPVGRYARQALALASSDDLPARVEANILSQETSAGQVLARVRLGAADAGLVYASDAAGLDTLALHGVQALYTLALVPGASPAAAAWRESTLGAHEIFASHGFEVP